MINTSKKEVRSGATRYFIRTLIAPVFMGILYFISAGSLSNYRAWFYFTLFFLLSALANGFLYFKKPELLYHRSRMKKDAKGWDKWLMPLAVISGFHLQCIVMGLDYRFRWSDIDSIAIPAGIILFLLSFLISSWAMFVNDHFEANVRIQADRGHKVISEGPYKFIRHPGYVTFIIGTVAVPLIIGSAIGIIIAFFASLLIIFRTYKEDNALQQELPGYSSYAKTVRYRLLPKIW
ncbi:MAG: isoprenylcysteine carboxylmethyltransferase family protein [Cytophagales bacterium]|nr:isoprenylcysteine carboxylmethyltransferase family protein [Cytophagales bacterium]